jgi:hypothetical protein
MKRPSLRQIASLWAREQALLYWWRYHTWCVTSILIASGDVPALAEAKSDARQAFSRADCLRSERQRLLRLRALIRRA